MVIQAPDTYTLILPPNWHRIPLRSGTTEAIDTALKARFGVPEPPDDDRRRSELIELTNAARRHDGLDLYTPLVGAPEIGGCAAFLVSAPAYDPARDPMHELSNGGICRPVVIDAAHGVRRERLLIADETECGVVARIVDYLFPVPGQERWIVASFTAASHMTDKGTAATHLVELFDAIMTTFRWRRLDLHVSSI